MKDPAAIDTAFREISRDLRTIRIAQHLDDGSVLVMEKLRYFIGADGVLMCQGGHHAYASSPFLKPIDIARMAMDRAHRLVNERFSITEQNAMPESANGVGGALSLARRLGRRLIGYHWTAQQAASLANMAVGDLIDPAMTAAIRSACGWWGMECSQVMTSWNVLDGQGRQVGFSARPIQQLCIAHIMRNVVRESSEGDVALSWTDGSTQVGDLVRVADRLPSALRATGVRPAFWRMALRMRPSQIRAMKHLLSTSLPAETVRLLNTFALIGEDALPPALLREISNRVSDNQDPILHETLNAVLQRAARGIADRPRRQPLKQAVAKLFEIVDHVRSQIPQETVETVSRHNAGPFDFGRLSDAAKHAPAEIAEIARTAVGHAVPHTQKWSHLVAASDQWHLDVQNDLDESDDRSWTPLLAEPVVLGGVVATDLHTAAELRAETRRCNHCVGGGGYASMCMTGGTRIVSLTVPGRRARSTIELRHANGQWTVAQHRGPSNSRPKPELETAVKPLMRAISKASAAALPMAA